MLAKAKEINSSKQIEYLGLYDFKFGLALYSKLNIEHPSFTAGVNQDWVYQKDGTPQYWQIDNYYYQGERKTHFLGCKVIKYHHTLTQILMGLLENGFEIKAVVEAEPPKEMMDIPGMKDEMRRPMMLIVKTVIKK